MMKKIKKKISNVIYNSSPISKKEVLEQMRLSYGSVQTNMRQLELLYQIHSTSQNKISFDDVGFSVFSQTNEDGILHYIFACIGKKNRICLDVAFLSPFGANTTNLILNDSWNGVLICGDNTDTEKSNKFFRNNRFTSIFPPKIYTKWVTAENINDLIKKGLSDLHCIDAEIDLFSLDIDGVDYWIWNALTEVSPRVVVVEYRDAWGEEAVTVPYTPEFNRLKGDLEFFGASLPAFVALGKKKGYHLIGCNIYGYNAFFLRNDCRNSMLPEASVSSCLRHPKVKYDMTKVDELRKMNWEYID